MRLIYYCLANAPEGPRDEQWARSIRSLRQHNADIDVCLFLFNGATAALLEEADRQHVTVHYLGEYREYLRARHIYGDVLSALPTFHKFFCPQHLPPDGATQLLYLDCDTFFFADVEKLFDECAGASVYGREEPNSRRSIPGGDPAHIDEEALWELAAREGLHPVAPFNCGVCLINGGFWRELGRLSVTQLDFAWRLLCGCQLGLGQDANHDPDIRAAVQRAWNEMDRLRALPYPSSNIWIIDEIALWLALGHVTSLSLGTFRRAQVAQGDEFIPMLEAGRPPILAHYFTNMENEFLDAVRPLLRESDF
jgi:hypothetical protein